MAHLTRIEIPIAIQEKIMNPELSGIIHGNLVFLETWTTIPTFCFESNGGAQYHDIPLEYLKIEVYHPASYWKIEEQPEVFEPTQEDAVLFIDSNTVFNRVKVVKGLVWDKNNIILYLCFCETSSRIFLWPTHKLLFIKHKPLFDYTLRSLKLPNWKKNKLNANNSY